MPKTKKSRGRTSKPHKPKKPSSKLGVHKMEHTPNAFKSTPDGKKMWQEYKYLTEVKSVPPAVATAVLKKHYGILDR